MPCAPTPINTIPKIIIRLFRLTIALFITSLLNNICFRFQREIEGMYELRFDRTDPVRFPKTDHNSLGLTPSLLKSHKGNVGVGDSRISDG